MSALSDVLIVIDLQNGVCHNGATAIHNFENLVELVNSRIASYQKEKRPIIFIQHSDEDLIIDTYSWEIIPELIQSPDNYFLGKTHANSFYQTSLQKLLTDLKVNSIEFCGAQTQYCMDTTIKFAHGLGYQLSLMKSASSTYDDALISAADMIRFYEKIWDKRFLTLLEEYM
ncbi:cysteine hydrolase family protein [Enterococcus sp. AZ163]|uniref:cysteine hydrolase family protein n=1 Tax=Enterococcus sp. AZ163 TaxID=2774638 RepID=UPI003D28C27F